MTLRIDYTNMLAGAVSTAASPHGRLGRRAQRDFRARARRGPGAPRHAGALGFLDLPRDARPPRAVARSSRQARARQVRRRRAAWHRRLGARPHRAAHGAQPSASGTRLRQEARASTSRASTCSTTSIRARSPTCSRRVALDRAAVHRDLQVRRHRRDDGAVSDRPRARSTSTSATRRATISSSSPIPRRARSAHIARERGHPALDIPPNVGGRFSVLTPVGVLPAALLGIDDRAAAGAARPTWRSAAGAANLARESGAVFAHPPVARRHARAGGTSTC